MPKSNNLDSYIQSSHSLQQPFATSQEIRDRGSTFVANLYPVTSPADARRHIDHVKNVVHANKPASHEIAAWRCMVLKHGRIGLEGTDDFELTVGSMDDGEKWAGERVLKVMQAHAIIDAVIIVSRWYGGTLLGPSRFSHIETCALEVCREFKRSEELRECLSTLTTLDAILAGLRDEYNDAEPTNLTKSTLGAKKSPAPKSYSNTDLVKAKRLITARENSIKSVQLLLSKLHEKERVVS